MDDTQPATRTAAAPKRRRRKSGTYAAADPRRAELLLAAMNHFAQWGYHAASLGRIAADVGISQAGLLHHFASKERLLLAVLELRDRLTQERGEAAGHHDGVAALLDRLVANAAYQSTRPGLVQMHANLATEAINPAHPAHAYFRTRHAEIHACVTAALRRGVATGEVRADLDIDAVAREIMATDNGLQLQWALTHGQFDLAQALRHYADQLLAGLCPPPAERRSVPVQRRHP